MTKKVLLLALAASVALGASSVASAHTSGTFDGDDTVSKLDLASAKLSHTTRAYKGRVATHDPFTNKALGATGEMYFDLDLAGTKRFDHYVWIDRASRSLTAKVFKVGRTRALGRATVKRVDTKTLEFSFPKKLVRRAKRAVGFGARTKWQEGAIGYGTSTLLGDKTPRGSHRF